MYCVCDGFSGFLPQSTNMAMANLANSKLPFGVNLNGCLLLSELANARTSDTFWVYAVFAPELLGQAPGHLKMRNFPLV